MKIALFSPLNPIETGVADYTEEMLFELAKYFSVDLYIEQDYTPANIEVQSDFNITPFNLDAFDPSKYDEIVYHMGNFYAGHNYIYESLKKYPGIVVLHDYVLQGFYVERYFKTRNLDEYKELLKKYYSQKGEEIAKDTAELMPNPIWESEEAYKYPLNEEIIEFAKAIIVHSNFVKNRIQRRSSKPVIKINTHGYPIKEFDNNKTREELGLESEDFLISSAGFVNKNKRYDVILSAISELKNPKIKYVIAGKDKGNILDNVLQDNDRNTIIKGHLSSLELEALISASDVCINLRYPTMGESSASLLRMMGYGKPSLVTDFGSYAELPSHCVIKIYPHIYEKEIIKRYITALIDDNDFRLSIGREAKAYVEKECSLEKCTSDYARFIKEQSQK
jgi:glycosyltransferase involved in cell wall biosynthesis